MAETANYITLDTSRLISAAPDLYVALRDLLACNEAEEGAEQDFAGAMERARAAILKATTNG